MQILNDAGTFGVSLSSTSGRVLSVFKIKIGDELLGDGEPSIEWTSVVALSRLRSVDDPRADPDRNTAAAILDVLTSEDEPALHDRTLVQFGGSMDDYICRSYLWGSEAVMIFKQIRGAAAGRIIVARVPADELVAIATVSQAMYQALTSAR